MREGLSVEPPQKERSQLRCLRYLTRMPCRWGISGISYWEEIPGQSQDTLQRLYLSAGFLKTGMKRWMVEWINGSILLLICFSDFDPPYSELIIQSSRFLFISLWFLGSWNIQFIKAVFVHKIGLLGDFPSLPSAGSTFCSKDFPPQISSWRITAETSGVFWERLSFMMVLLCYCLSILSWSLVFHSATLMGNCLKQMGILVLMWGKWLF